MIFFPIIYEDELLYSVIARYHIKSGNITMPHTFKDTFSCYYMNPSIYLPINIDKLIDNMPINCKYTSDYIIKEHTLFSFVTLFIGTELSNEVENLMKCNSKTKPHSILSIGATSLNRPKYLRFCPDCLEEDIKKYGETYWHISHQIPGMVVCIKHKKFLINSTVLNSSYQQKYVEASERNCLLYEYENSYSSKTIEHLYNLANDIETSLKITKKSKNDILFKENYINYLKSKGYITLEGRVRKKDLVNDFKNFYGNEFLNILNSNLEYGDTHNWLQNLLISSKSNKYVNPIHHLLLIRFIGVDLQKIFSEQYEFKPFGDGPWPCLNKICSNYKKDVIENVELSYNYRAKSIIGTFRCDCGYIYTRRENKDIINNKYHIDKVKSLGVEWDNKLKELVQLKTLSLNRIADLMYSDTKTVDIHSERLELDTYWRVDNEYKYKKEVVNNDVTAADILEYEFKWTQLINDNKGMTRSELRKLLPNVYEWLYNHDKQWLYENLPKTKKYTNQNKELVDWKRRDNEMLESVTKVVTEILNDKVNFIRVTTSRIGLLIGNKTILKNNLEKMPKTKKYLESVRESNEDFILRKVRVTVETFYELEYEFSINDIIKYASISKVTFRKYKNMIVKEIDSITLSDSSYY